MKNWWMSWVVESVHYLHFHQTRLGLSQKTKIGINSVESTLLFLIFLPCHFCFDHLMEKQKCFFKRGSGVCILQNESCSTSRTTIYLPFTHNPRKSFATHLYSCHYFWFPVFVVLRISDCAFGSQCEEEQQQHHQQHQQQQEEQQHQRLCPQSSWKH